LSLEWDYYKLEELINLRTGKLDSNAEEENGNYPFFTCAPDPLKINSFSFDQPAILLAGNNANGNFHINYYEGKFDAYQRTYVIDVLNKEKIDLKFLYYAMKICLKDFKRMSQGTSTRFLTKKILDNFEIQVPNMETQLKIVEVLDAISNKININQRINKNLFNIASSIQTEWMINFTPFKSEKFKTSSFGLIPENWNVGKLGDVIELLDSKRIPLSGQQRENMEKIYPYYGAASLMDYVEDYIFDGVYLLMGEDGTVVDDKGFPILQYVWGKFWVNNHAHILKGKNGFNVESLYLLLSKTNIQSIVTGAVQAKVNQSNLKSIEIIIPPVDVMEKFNKLIKPFFDTIRSNNDEIKELQKLRDTLLPKLMSGEIDVSKINCDLLIKILEFLFFMIIN